MAVFAQGIGCVFAGVDVSVELAHTSQGSDAVDVA